MPKLNEYQVRGYKRKSPISRTVKIQATSEDMAAATYARCNGLKREHWDVKHDQPYWVAIRVSDAGQIEP